MEEAEGEVDSVDCGEAKAFVAGTVDGDVVEENALQLLDGPVGEQDPGEQRVEEQDEGVCDSRGDRGRAFACRAAEGRACCRAAARGSEGEELYHRIR